MSGIIDIVQQQLSGGAIQQIAQRVGVDPATAQKAVNAALPMIVGSLGQHAATADTAQPANAGSVPNASALLGGLSGVLGGQGDAGGLLGKIMGGRQDDVHNAVSNAAGIDKGKAAQIVEMIIPMVMSALANRNQQAQQSRANAAEPRPGT